MYIYTEFWVGFYVGSVWRNGVKLEEDKLSVFNIDALEIIVLLHKFYFTLNIRLSLLGFHMVVSFERK